MITFSKDSSKVVFEPKSHTYTFLPTNKKFISVSTLVSKYKPVFDPNNEILKRCALKEGISEEELKQRWEDKKNIACEFGTKIHADIENFIKTGDIVNNENKEFVKQFSKIKFKGKLFSEVLLYSDLYSIAGTTDLIQVLDKRSLVIWDFKSNESIKKKAYWKPEYMFYPLNHLPNLNFFHYRLQLSTYSLLLEELGWDIIGIKMLHFEKKSNTLIHYDMDYARIDVLNMLNHYNDPINFKKIKPPQIEDKGDII